MAEINAFHEEEKLEHSTGANAPILTQAQLSDLPVGQFEVTEAHDDNNVIVTCPVCQQEIKDGETIRTTLCLHIFH